MKSIEDFVGFSESNIGDAFQNALNNAGNPVHCAVVETLCFQKSKTRRYYRVILKTMTEKSM
ncbi:hypothetical protein [Legionella worsleiensis]|uniref:Uncharacterized protein n=1 Tax=Legionella worsleiensis TaxID=45076 RepID=A0A0W1AJJ8_9GAMM|nr:hypothetical protein [Legionella worsleiensis]KTD81533.1 hypothetical protein Lwor_0571 [Legionella worsleiensis]STY32092.1 Uncharacterised protein [Legionella worsleiensis]